MVQIQEQKRLLPLDIMRSAAILFVVVYHFEGDLFGQWGRLKTLKDSLWMGVDIFFVLSGYLISSHWIKDIRLTSANVAFKNFYIKRVFRIMPNYFLILGLHILMALWVGRQVEYYKYFLWIQNFSSMEIFIPSWSLCVEEHFYLMFPVLSWLFWVWGGRVWLFRFSVVGVGLSLLIRSFLAQRLNGQLSLLSLSELETYFYYPTYSRLDGLFAGVIVAVCQEHYIDFWSLLQRRCRGIGIVAVGFFLISLFVVSDRMSIASQVLGPFLLAITFSLCLIYALSLNIQARGALHFFTWTSEISYSMYLMFYFSQIGLFLFFRKIDFHPHVALHFFIYIITTYAFSYCLFLFWEKPFLKMRYRFLK